MEKRNYLFAALILMIAVIFTSCGTDEGVETQLTAEIASETKSPPTEATVPETTILVAAAASLEYCMKDELIPMFEELNPGIKVEGTYDSSGKLQTQIEEGADADVFVSAAMKQMEELDEAGLIEAGTIVELLENKIVLITPVDSTLTLNGFEDILNAEMIAIGDPESVPAGQYAKEALEYLDLWEEVSKKASLGSNVTEVLNWVGQGSADAGIVYATDAAVSEDVVVVASAPDESVSKIIYPAGIVSATTKEDAARLFIDFLQTEDASKVFARYGFTPIN